MIASSAKSLLSWTGHPLVDMGVAALVVFAGRTVPEEVNQADLERFARYADEAYFSPELASYLTVLFTSNFINPSFTPARKKEFVKQICRLYNAPADKALPPCIYCARPSVRLAHRDLIPMLTGREAVNFFPGGAPGLALCGNCVVALQALTIGAPMVSGRALVVSSDTPHLTLQLVRTWQPEVRKRIQLSEQTGEKLPPVTRPLTRVIEALVSIESERRDIESEGQDGLSSSITVYHLTNSGQGPQADIYFLPSSVVRFVVLARAARYAATWKELVRQAWEIPPKPKKGEKSTASKPPFLRNYLYEDLFNLPDRSGAFIRAYFLRKANRYAQGVGDPRTGYSGWRDYIPGLWELTSLFIREVTGMDTQRIEAIRKLGDTLADEISSENDRRLWWSTYTADTYRAARLALIQVSHRRVKRGFAPVVSFDGFLEVFEEGQDLPRTDWRLAWDLVLIKVIDRLFETKWFEQNRDALKEEESEPEVKEV
jgi:CRISPR-associated protein Cst1